MPFLISALAFVCISNASDSAHGCLPGENGSRPALSPAPFPDRMSAYVWRNWGLVDKVLLAETVGAKPEDLAAVAEQMGLDPDPVVLPEWKKKGYITIIRRNWHLLPYDQILKLIGKTRDELYFCLMEDDFLWIKLGSVKPRCDRLHWSPLMLDEGRAARERLAAILKEEGLDPRAPEEPRFQFVKVISAVDSDFRLPEKDTSPFDFRLIFSYFANYADPLGDPEIGSFPEGLLQKLAAQGVNAVWMHTVLRTLVKDPKYPEFGAGCENRIANLQKLIDRCRKYGIRVFLYMNEPRGLNPDFFKIPGRERLGGVVAGGLQAMCTLNPETQRWLSDSLEKVFSSVRGLGGIFTITASENLTNCATRPGFKETCPVCKSHTRGEIIAAANTAMLKGMRKGDPNAEALVWNWAWPKDEEADIVARLPKEGCRLMAVSENAMPICRGGVSEEENDYSISIVGPGENAKRFWGFAKKCGIPAVAKVQAANSWEISPFPYIPTMDLVARHACNIANEGVNGVMLSWSLGCCPSPNLGVYRDLRRGERTPDALLDRMATRLYGEANVKRVRQAWTAFSDGFANYPFSCQTIYVAPHHWGPVNPLYAKRTGYKATMVGIPYDDLDGWRCKYPGETYAELIGKVADGFAEGCRLLEGVAEKKELDMFRAEQMHFASCRDQARFVMARDSGDAEEMRRCARAELDRAKAYWSIVRADSRIGFESSNQYYFVPRDVLEKVLSCRMVLDRPADEMAHNETALWQDRIDFAATNGGGVVSMPAGRHFLSGLFLKSGVTLRLEKGCVVEGTTDILDYPDIHLDYAEIREPWQAIIAAVGQTNVAVVGEGEIRGNGDRFPCGSRLGRPRGMIFYKCGNVRVEGLKMTDLASWTCYFNECDGVVFRKMTVDSHANHNNDGVDIDARNVLVEDCDIDADDDGIVIKSDNPNFIVENVEVRNCEVRSCASLFKLGTASHGGFRNISFHDCTGGKVRREFIDPKTGNGFMSDYRASVFPGSTVAPCPIGGLIVECVDGALVDGVSFRRMTIRDCCTPIFVRAETRLGRKWGNRIPLGIPFGTGLALKNVVFEDIRASARSFTASSITGVSLVRPQNIVLRNVEIDMPGSGERGREEIGCPVPEVEDGYPDPYMFAHRMLPAYGFYVRHADDVTFENVRVKVNGCEFRPMILRDDVSGF